jgi:AcrR family transcriptional regulator
VPTRARLPNASKARRGAGAGDKPAATRRTQKGQQTRERLVQAARTVFEEQGFLHARIADVCTQARTSHGTFYTYFDSKEAIFKEVVDSVELDLLAVVPAPEDADPVERIRAANRHYLETYRANAKIMAVIHQVATFDPDVRATRSQRQNALAAAIERRTRAYQEAGLADPDVDPRYAAQALGGMVAFFAEELFAQDNGFTLDDAVEQLTILWANAVGLSRGGTS